MGAVQELTYKVNFDPAVATAEMRKWTTSVEANLRQIGIVEKQQAAVAVSVHRQTESAKLRVFQQSINQIAREEQRRVAEVLKAANQRLREEQRAAREVARINAETTRQAIAQERIRERAAKQLADVQIREAKRAARELERSLSSSGGGTANFAAVTGALGRAPGIGGITSGLSAVTSASTAAGAATAGLAGPLAIAVAGFVAEAAIVAAVSHELFDLAKQTAEFKGRLFDMSQQVGISVETLSGLEILAATTGGNIETVAASMAIFQRNLEQAHDPTSKEAQLLRELGVTSTDTEEALRQTLTALFAMGEGSAQTSAVLELFGRSGRFVNAILKESHGDLDKAIAKFRELGIIVSTEDAKAADEFNDTLATLNFQLRGLTALVGQEVMPVVLGVLTDLQKLLKDNRDAVEALGAAAKVTAILLGAPFKGSIIGLNVVMQEHKAEIALIVALYKQWAELIDIVRKRGVPEVSPDAIPAQPLGREDGIELLRKLQEAWKAQLRPFNLNEIFRIDKDKASAAADPGLALLRQLQGELRRLATETKAEEVAAQLLDEQFKDVNATLREQILVIARTIDMRRAANDAERLAAELAEKNKQQIQAAGESLSQFLRQQNETLRQLRFGDKTAIQEAEEFIALFPKWTGAMRETETFSESFWLKFNAHLIDSARRMKIMIDLMKEMADTVPAPGGRVPEGVPEIPINVGLPPPETLEAQIDAAIRAQGAFGGLSVAISDTLGLGAESAIAFAESMSFAFGSVAQAVGEAVRAFVLFGTAQGGFRKFAAEVIASIAQMAVVQAIWEGAQGLAMLALTWFTGNPKYAQSAGAHFAAAATYGLIAGVAVPLGRKVAGNTFQQDGAAGGSSATSSGPGQLNPLELERRAQPPPPQRLVLQVNVKQDKHSIVEVFAEDFQSGGRTREVVNNDGVFTG